MKTTNAQMASVRSGRILSLRGVVGLCTIVFAAAGLSACAAGPSFFERGGLSSEASTDAAWQGAVQPKPVPASTVVRVGSQPLLPPVPETNVGLAPIKVTAFAD